MKLKQFLRRIFSKVYTSENNNIKENVFTYKNSRGTIYYLKSMEVTLHNNLNRTLFYFGRNSGKHDINKVPSGYKIMETKSGLPILKEK